MNGGGAALPDRFRSQFAKLFENLCSTGKEPT
jgi:hypothetical protein